MEITNIILALLVGVTLLAGIVSAFLSNQSKSPKYFRKKIISDFETLSVFDRQLVLLLIEKLKYNQAHSLDNNDNGIINPYTGFPYIISDEMIDFLAPYITEYRDYPDAKIVIEFAERFRIDINHAKEIERNYVIYNRNRIYDYINSCMKDNEPYENIIAHITETFGMTTDNAERYVRRARMDSAEVLIGSDDNERE